MKEQLPVREKSYRMLQDLVSGTTIVGEVILPSGEMLLVGSGEPQFRVTLRDSRLIQNGLNESDFAKAYINGNVEIEGNIEAVLRLRGRIKDRLPVARWLHFIWLLFHQETKVNKAAIDAHYQLGDDLFLSFIDAKYRLYSHGIFSSANDTLEDASENRLNDMFNALELRPGMRLLDIGGGWGGVAEYCGQRGVEVTVLTLGEDSRRFIMDIITKSALPCNVALEDFLVHRPEKPYDAIVILGVIEHIINYRRFFQQIRRCLRVGGKLYLDASASVEKFDVSVFAREYIWTGTHSYLCLQDLVRELLYHGMELLYVKNDSKDYGLTMYHWALRLEENRAKITARYGESLYRAWRLYLWGGSQCFPSMLQAYTLVAALTDKRSAPPTFVRRFLHFIGR